MLLVSSNLYVYGWLFLILSLACFFGFLFVFHLLVSGSVSVFVDCFSVASSSFTFVITSDLYSSLFSMLVCAISSVVFAFTLYYFSSFVKYTYFLWLTFLFVVSILVLINFSDIFFVMLGWDGLGVVSFFLIAYYQSSVSSFSAIFTVLINRLGDCLFVVLITVYCTVLFSGSYLFYDYSLSYALGGIMVSAFMTKSALFPFSPWLPAAMAAPTPISALVHSSTLVTAGLFLIIRNYSFLASSSSILHFLVVVGLFTSFYAGLSSLFEPDLKKVVALSTLSHLGFICLGLGLGWPSLAFFHLLTHALFNSTLFISIGGMISSYYHYQDSRYFSVLFSSNFFSSVIMVVSSCNLFGLPFMGGFYSNDLVLESFSYSGIGYFMSLLIFFNLLFTYGYTFRILTALFSPSYLSSYKMYLNCLPIYVIALSLLSLLSVVFGVAYGSILSIVMFYTLPVLNFAPFILLLGSLVIYTNWITSFPVSFYFLFPFALRFTTSISFLAPVWSNILPKASIAFGVLTTRFVELGGLSLLVMGFFSEGVVWVVSYFLGVYANSYRLTALLLGLFYFVFVLIICL